MIDKEIGRFIGKLLDWMSFEYSDRMIDEY